MFSGPLFRREYRAATVRRRPFVFRTGFAFLFSLVAVLIGLFIFTAHSGHDTSTRLLYLGRSLFIATICIEFLSLVFLVPAHVGGAIAEEREKDTLPSLLLTRLTPIEIVMAKTMARALPTLNLILIGLPVLLASAWLAGLEPEIVPAVLVLVSSTGFMASLAILASAHREQAGPARAQATASIFGWLLVPPIFTIIPIRTSSLLGGFLDAMREICVIVAPSSPLSLVTDSRWYSMPRLFSLEERVALMIGLQALFGLLALGFAASRLKARERNPNWLDPTRGYRPPCGDDPIYWREYELPMRRGGASVLVLRLRYVWILVRAILMTVLTLMGTLLVLAVPIGLLVATMHYGFQAFRELWQHGYGLSGPFLARGDFNMVVRAGTALLAFMPALGSTALIAGRITTERDRKTWDALLMTPLSGQEILHSKARAAIHLFWQAARALPILWVLGLACGVVLPIGIALAAIDLLLIVWVSLALGLYQSLRPGSTSAASSAAALSTVVLFPLQAPLLWAALASPRELAEFASWNAPLRWSLVLCGLTALILTGAVAWFLTRRTIERFDEWVGRPCAARVVQPETGA